MLGTCSSTQTLKQFSCPAKVHHIWWDMSPQIANNFVIPDSYILVELSSPIIFLFILCIDRIQKQDLVFSVELHLLLFLLLLPNKSTGRVSS